MNNSNERWMPALRNSNYEVSSNGRIKRKGAQRELKQNKSHRYARVSLGANCTTYVHIAVLESFVCARPAGKEARHLNGDAFDNSLSNLRWGTSVENAADSKRHGTFSEKERHGMAKLSQQQVNSIRQERINGYSYPALGRMFCISTSNAHRICTMENWK